VYLCNSGQSYASDACEMKVASGKYIEKPYGTEIAISYHPSETDTIVFEHPHETLTFKRISQGKYEAPGRTATYYLAIVSESQLTLSSTNSSPSSLVLKRNLR
jgi:hypothetical protein